MRQLNTIDSLFVFMDQRGPGMSMAMLQVFSAGKNEDPIERFNSIVARIEAAVPVIPMLHQKLYRVPGDADKPYWIVEDQVDMDYHIRHLAVPPPGSWDQLTELFGQLCSLPMDMEMPLWRVYIIEGLNGINDLPDNSFAVITKMHHAAADGITAAKVTSIIAGAPLMEVNKKDEAMPVALNVYDVMAKSVTNNLSHSFKLGLESLTNVASMYKWGYKSVMNRVLGRGSKTKVVIPKTRFNGMLSPDRVFDSIRFSREEINVLRENLNGITINDIALAVCGGALREYLISKGELPEESLRCVMPISIRGEEVGGNQFSVARIPLGTNIELPLQRLQSIRRETSKSKDSMKGEGSKRFKELSNLIPGPMLAIIFRNLVKYGLIAKIPPLANCMVSSVPGSPKRIKFGKNELVYMNGSPPLTDGLGLIFGIMGYGDDVIISITSCKQMVPDKSFMLKCLQNSYDQLIAEIRADLPLKTKQGEKVKKISAKPVKKKVTKKKAVKKSVAVVRKKVSKKVVKKTAKKNHKKGQGARKVSVKKESE